MTPEQLKEKFGTSITPQDLQLISRAQDIELAEQEREDNSELIAANQYSFVENLNKMVSYGSKLGGNAFYIADAALTYVNNHKSKLQTMSKYIMDPAMMESLSQFATTGNIDSKLGGALIAIAIAQKEDEGLSHTEAVNNINAAASKAKEYVDKSYKLAEAMNDIYNYFSSEQINARRQAWRDNQRNTRMRLT